MTYKPFKIYDAGKSNVASSIFGGEASGVRDWDNIRYPSMLDINKSLSEEFWTEDEIKLIKDDEQYKSKVSKSEKYAFNILSGMLNELDSVATDFNMYLFMMLTDPSIRSIVTQINYFENLHNRSYQYLTSTMLNESEKKQAFEDVKNIEVLQKRNRHVYEHINMFVGAVRHHIANDLPINDDFLEKAFKGIIAYQNLEGLHFTGAFVYFHSLARDNKMIGSNNMINLIKADEVQHSEFYGTLIRIMLSEFPQLNTKENMDFAVNFVKECVEHEKEWGRYIFKDIETLNIKEYDDYVEYLANLTCRNAGIIEPFPNNTELKSKWIVTYGSKKRDEQTAKKGKQIVTRSSFLEGNAPNYAHRSEEDFDL
jgi:ribonucleoside-diphosphate reductase beta chain